MRANDDGRANVLRAWWLTAFLLLTGFSFGVFLNDEGAQLEAIYHFRQGQVEGNETPLQFYAIAEGTILPVWQTDKPIQSPLVTLVGVALYYPVKVIDMVVPVLYLLVALWGMAGYFSVRGIVDRVQGPGKWYSEAQPRFDGAWHQRMARRVRWNAGHTSFPHRLLLAVTILGTLLLWVSVPSLDYDVWGELVALQLGHATLTLVGAVLFKRVITQWSGDRTIGWLAWVFYMASPILFWGIGAKYHAMSVFLAIVTMWLWQRDDRWRHAAVGVAALGAMTAALGIAMLVAVLLVEAWDLWRLRKANPVFFRRSLAVGGATVSLAAVAILTYNRIVWGTFAGRRGPQGEDVDGIGGLVDYIFEVLRFEGWGQSFENLWRVFIDSRTFESAPASLLSLMPLMIFAFAVPWLLWKRKEKPDRQVVLAVLHIVLFFGAFVHALNRPGAGADNRFAVILLPSFILLTLKALEKPLKSVPGALWGRIAWTTPVVLLGSILLLSIFAKQGHVIYEGQGALQIRHYAYWLGTATWSGWLLFSLTPVKWWMLDRLRTMSWLGGASLAAPVLWLFHTMILFRRSLPPWPFGSGNDEVSFVLPHWVGVREWMIETLLPL